MSDTADPRPTLYRRGLGWLGRLEDGAIVRAAFFALLAGTLCVLYVDFRELMLDDRAALTIPDMPVLPAFDPDDPAPVGPEVTTDPGLLRAPLSIALVGGGVLELTGTIDPGAAARFAAEVEARGEYIDTVALNSPGGSVDDALAMGELLRARGFATSVGSGAMCASSCPLVFAAGVERHADAAAVIGVHQIYASVATGALPQGARAAGIAMSEAQKTTAVVTRYLSTMGVDPALWLHALETPPDRLYYLTPEELAEFRLVTGAETETPATGTGETDGQTPG
jgi:hypothetical protein